MKILKFLLLFCLVSIVLTGCMRGEPTYTDPPAETTVRTAVTTETATSLPETTAPITSETAPVTLETTASETASPMTAESAVIGSTAAVPVTASTEPEPESVMVPILMFHDIKASAGGPWSMSADNFRAKMELLLENGYTPVTFGQLVDYVDGKGALPDNPVCITFDDGYYSNYKYVLPIVTELDIPITVFVICEAVRPEGVDPDPNEDVLSMMSAAELTCMEESPLVQLQPHTYGLHIAGYGSDEKRGDVLPLASESKADYQQMFSDDCALAENVLTDVGVEEQVVFSYPGGRYHAWSEAVLKQRGYRVTLTTNSGHRNLVVVGDPESLFLLGRMNVNDDTTDKDLLGYLKRK